MYVTSRAVNPANWPGFPNVTGARPDGDIGWILYAPVVNIVNKPNFISPAEGSENTITGKYLLLVGLNPTGNTADPVIFWAETVIIKSPKLLKDACITFPTLIKLIVNSCDAQGPTTVVLNTEVEAYEGAKVVN